MTAFANAGGGILVYGVAEKKVGAESMAVDFALVENTKVTVDQLTQIIRFQTSPPLSKFHVDSFLFGEGRVFIVRIDRADTACSR